MTRFDTIVIGGGPAGSVAALLAARRGRRVGLIEKRAAGEQKACGHCLNPRARRLLEDAGVWPAVAGAAAGRPRCIRVHHHRWGTLQRAQETLLMPRDAFDEALLREAERAGVRVARPASATGFEIERETVRVELRDADGVESWDAPFVVGADGLGSRVARALQLSATRPRRGRDAYGFSFDVPAREPGDEVHMHLMRDGYLGTVHERGRLHVAALVRSAIDPFEFTRAVAAAHPRLARLADADRSSVARFAAIGPMPFRPRAVACSRGALIGDAAGYVEPITGEGMSWAIESAMLLDRAGDAAAYARAYRRGVRRRQWWCRFVTAALRRPRLTDLLFVAMSARSVRRVPA